MKERRDGMGWGGKKGRVRKTGGMASEWGRRGREWGISPPRSFLKVGAYVLDTHYIA